MRALLVTGIWLALVAPLCAETYSWLDDGGTFHFTEDYSSIPKKYQNKVNQRGDTSPEQTPAPAADVPGKKGAAEVFKTDVSGDGKAAGSSDGSVQLFGGKTADAWHRDVAFQEQELKRLEALLDALQKQVKGHALSRERLAEVKKEYKETRTTYNRKYEEYSTLLESARKAGLAVEMKK